MITFLDSRYNWDDTVFVSLPGSFQLFLSISQVYASLGKKSLFGSFAHFLIRLLGRGLLFRYQTLIKHMPCKYFPPSIHWFFSLLMISFAVWNFLFSPVIFTFGFVVRTFGAYPKPMPRSIAKSFFFPYAFFQKFYSFRSHS